MADPREALGAYIREQRRQAELSMRKLADLAGVSNPYLSQIERGLKRPSAEILQQLARALEVSAEQLYVRAGILDEPPTPIWSRRSAPRTTSRPTRSRSDPDLRELPRREHRQRGMSARR